MKKYAVYMLIMALFALLMLSGLVHAISPVPPKPEAAFSETQKEAIGRIAAQYFVTHPDALRDALEKAGVKGLQACHPVEQPLVLSHYSSPPEAR
ncbi:hypothetical protein LHL03_04840 [Pectobacterium carotovorum]|uniref:hypothetical protein n=1 Tax=Pectobacterium carotovorum TaxID=554 RepID=UPI001CFC0606|nr:hypothetical protein [Pectobacterium carotovorum]UCZ80478.1 hypothetical protein LHL03_04840 [Pectobacterium carotovorum]